MISTVLQFPDDVRDVLRKAGWSKAAQTDIRQIVDDLRTCGYKINPAAERILRSFAGLEIIGPTGLSLSCKDVAFVGKIYYHHQIDSLLDGLFRDAYPIGQACSACLFILPDGTSLGLDYDCNTWFQFPSFERLVEVVLGLRPIRPEEKAQYILSHPAQE